MPSLVARTLLRSLPSFHKLKGCRSRRASVTPALASSPSLPLPLPSGGYIATKLVSVRVTESLAVQLVLPEDCDQVLDHYIDSGQEHGDVYWCTLWQSAKVLAAHIAGNPELVRGKVVCELGAGLGLPGIVAALSGARAVILTDKEALALECCRRSLAANGLVESSAGPLSTGEPRSSLDVARACQVRVEALDWAELPRNLGCDVVLGCDLLYEKEMPQLVASTAAHLMKLPGSYLYLADPKDRTPQQRGQCQGLLQAAGLVLKEAAVRHALGGAEEEGEEGEERGEVQVLHFERPLGRDTVGVKLAAGAAAQGPIVVVAGSGTDAFSLFVQGFEASTVPSHALSLTASSQLSGEGSLFIETRPSPARADSATSLIPLASQKQSILVDAYGHSFTDSAVEVGRQQEALAASSPVAVTAALVSPFAALNTQGSHSTLTTYASGTSAASDSWHMPQAAAPSYIDASDVELLSGEERSLYLAVAEELAGEDSACFGSSQRASLERRTRLLLSSKSGPLCEDAPGDVESAQLSEELLGVVQQLKGMVRPEAVRRVQGRYGLIEVLKHRLKSEGRTEKPAASVAAAAEPQPS